MRNALKFLLALAVAFVAMLAFRSLVLTVCTIGGSGLEPVFTAGDRVVVNRWSYGLRTGQEGSLFDYGRLCRQDVRRGDLIAFQDSLGRLLICRCAALPGDTVALPATARQTGRTRVVIPGLSTCADQNYYWVEPVGKNNATSSRQLGFIPEECIVGRACLVLYSRDPEAPFWKGYRRHRLLLPL